MGNPQASNYSKSWTVQPIQSNRAFLYFASKAVCNVIDTHGAHLEISGENIVLIFHDSNRISGFWEDKIEPIIEPNIEPNIEPIIEPNIEPNIDPKIEPNIEPNNEPINEPNDAPNINPNIEPKI